MRRVIWATALLALTFASACTSSAGSPTAAPINRDNSQNTTSALPATTPPPSTPTLTGSTPTPTPPHQTDPGVKALRAWAAAAARAVNAGHFDSSALDKLMTAGFRHHMKAVLGNSLGYRYPGPIPFTPKSVHVSGSTERQIDCVRQQWVCRIEKDGQPKGKLQVTPLDARVRRTNGHWLVAALYNGSFSCHGVHIRKAA